ncbi:MAG: 4'-phosphopantetheinyl transferase superfamily protein [Deltaproteobacteria bacterium]|nr:4'-phosphopantetheinyl transferase superfamily protein [Deltaproteobacteria bacterium]
MTSHVLTDFNRNVGEPQAPLDWRPGPPRPSLAEDQVHLWLARLDLELPRAGSLWGTLSKDERTMAGRFYFRKDRERFIATRGLLRAILGRYLGQEPASLRFRYGPHGKPYLALGGDVLDLRFNLSHSQNLALYAVALGREVGVDLERVRFDETAMEIATQFFSTRELAALRALPEHTRTETFFKYWTVKEAYLKAKGEGLGGEFEKFIVRLEDGRAELLSTTGDRLEDMGDWEVKTLMPMPSFVAALAVAGRDWELINLWWLKN